MDPLIEKCRSNLLRRRSALLELARAPHPELEPDEKAEVTDVATAVTDEKMWARMGALRRGEIAEIDSALARMDDGSWGVCASCGGPIGRQRLLALPEARHCLACRARTPAESR